MDLTLNFFNYIIMFLFLSTYTVLKRCFKHQVFNVHLDFDWISGQRTNITETIWLVENDNTFLILIFSQKDVSRWSALDRHGVVDEDVEFFRVHQFGARCRWRRNLRERNKIEKQIYETYQQSSKVSLKVSVRMLKKQLSSKKCYVIILKYPGPL